MSTGQGQELAPISRTPVGDGLDYEDLEADDDYVITRSGQKEPLRLEKIVDRIQDLAGPAYGKRLRNIKRVVINQRVIMDVKSGMTTREIDDLAIQACETLTSLHPEYSTLAARFKVSNLHKGITVTFPEVYRKLYATGKSRIHPGFMELVERFGDVVEKHIQHHRDYKFDAFAINTVVRMYLLRYPDGTVAELPQHMFARVALCIRCLQSGRKLGLKHNVPIQDPTLLGYAVEDALKISYPMLSEKLISHASPTLFNAGCSDQLSSCFQAECEDDFTCIYQAFMDIAIMSKNGGGISLSIDRMRSEGQLIKSSGGLSQGPMPFLTMTQYSQQYANQGGIRPGAFAIYLTPHIGDVLNILKQALSKGPIFEHRKDAHKLKFAMFMPDLFMRVLLQELDVRERLRKGEPVPEEEERTAGDWYLFSHDSAPMLAESYDERSIHHPDGPGGTYSDWYFKYLDEGKSVGKVKTSEVIRAMVEAIGHRGTPYVLWRDHINRGSNLAIPGSVRTVVSSNLCAEVTIPARHRAGEPDATLHSVCNLASIPLPNYVVDDFSADGPGKKVDYAAIIKAAGVLAEHLDNIIDLNGLPVEGSWRSNQFFRAIGIGVIGLADIFLLHMAPWGSANALELDAAIHACIYYGALRRSSELAESRGNFPAYADSAVSKGLLRPDLAVKHGFLEAGWETEIERSTGGLLTPGMWETLRDRIRVNPVTGKPGFCRNGELTCSMPTATSSNVMGNEDGGMTEGIDPPSTFLFTRKTLAGEYIIMNSHLVRWLKEHDLYSDHAADVLQADGGSISSWNGTMGRPNVPEDVRAVFRTAREIDQVNIAIHAGVRQPYLTMSQAVNTFYNKIRSEDLLNVWFTSWFAGASTGSYYSHSMARSGTQKTNIDRSIVRSAGGIDPPDPSCRLVGGKPDPSCEACSA